ncbi:MAG: NAD(P)/FAD-dependent oxidoreductase [Myxococcales bacterium]
MQTTKVAIIGAGPAGLTAAYLLSKEKVPVTVIEADPRLVGGIARTASYKGYNFDIGGHRFFSKSKEVEDLWTELLPNDMLDRPRLSRIFYRGKFFSYPLKAVEALLKLGFIESVLCVLSYLEARLFPVKNPKNVEEWVTNQFGKRLYGIFFKTYTEKGWGMSCREISADWAAQRIKGLSLVTAVVNAVLPKRKPKDKSQVIKTLIDSFRYPRKGPGMMWETCAARVRELGGIVRMGERVTGLSYDPSTKLWTVRHGSGTTVAEHVISSAPIRELARGIQPPLPQAALDAANRLKYRDFLTVVLILKDKQLFDDNWIYIHEPDVLVGRIQNFKSWSPEMVPDPAMACLGLEYFCFEGDGTWTMNDEDLIALGKKELAKIGLATAEDVVDGCVVRQHKAYPVYDDGYAQNVEIVRRELAARYPNLHLVGRNGMHKYNNQDHAMMTAMLCAKNIVAGKPLYDLWQVNQDAEYHEAGGRGAESTTGLRDVPKRLSA